jgi:DNA-binding winged helix-turn-helix (wHTH) protein
MATDTYRISDPATASFVFGPFRLFPMQRLLMEADRQVQLGSRAFDILVALLERPGELVTKEELIANVWPNTFVAAANLAVHISALRRVLGDRCPQSRYVINIPGRGYRFVAAVTVEKGSPSGLAAAAAPARDVAPAETAHNMAHQVQEQHSLTIVGPDGVGETTTALALVQKLIEAQGRGVWVVGFGPREVPHKTEDS